MPYTRTMVFVDKIWVISLSYKKLGRLASHWILCFWMFCFLLAMWVEVVTFNHVGSPNLSCTTTRDVWIILSFEIWGYVLFVEPVSCVIMNSGQHLFSSPCSSLGLAGGKHHRNTTIPIFYTWWRDQMGTFSALLAICAGNSPASGEFPAQKASDAELWCFLWSVSE